MTSTLVYILENCPEKLVIRYATDLDDMHCFFTFKCVVSSPPYMENGSLGSIRMDTRAQRGETSMFGSLGMCRSHSFLRPLLLSSAWYRFMGSSNLKKTVQFHNLVSLNRVAILLQFALGSESKGFSSTAPTILPLNLPPPPGEVYSLIHNDNLAKTAWSVFFRVKNEKKLVSWVNLPVLANNSHFQLFHGNGARSDWLVNPLIHLFNRIINILLYDSHLFYTL